MFQKVLSEESTPEWMILLMGGRGRLLGAEELMPGGSGSEPFSNSAPPCSPTASPEAISVVF